ESFGSLVRRRAELEAGKSGLVVDEKAYSQQVELLRSQIDEIARAQLVPGEEESVEQEYRRAGNAARLLQLSRTALELLGESEGSLLTQAGVVGRTLQDLGRVDPSAHGILQLHQETVSALSELQGAISRYADKVEVDPARLQHLEERLNLIQSLKRKH